MKPQQKESELRRSLARMARQIQSPYEFVQILGRIPEPQKRRQFYRAVSPLLKFKPPALEEIL